MRALSADPWATDADPRRQGTHRRSVLLSVCNDRLRCRAVLPHQRGTQACALRGVSSASANGSCIQRRLDTESGSRCAVRRARRAMAALSPSRTRGPGFRSGGPSGTKRKRTRRGWWRLEIQSCAGRDRWLSARMDRVDDLARIDPLQVGAGRAEVGMLDMRVIWRCRQGSRGPR
jgi:hypothetical protein